MTSSLTRQKVLPVLAIFLALSQLGVCLYYLVRAGLTHRSLERYSEPIPEAPPGTDPLFDQYAYTRPLLALALVVVVVIVTVITARMSHPSTEADPGSRISPWIPIQIALAGFVLLSILFTTRYVGLYWLLIAFALVRIIGSRWKRPQARG